MSITCSGDTPISKRLAISSRADQAPAEVTPLVPPNPARTSLFTPSGGRLSSSSESEGFWYLLLLSDLEDFLPALLSDRSRRRSLLSLLLFGTALLFHSSNLLLPLGGPEVGSAQIGPPPPLSFSSIRWVGEKEKWKDGCEPKWHRLTTAYWPSTTVSLVTHLEYIWSRFAVRYHPPPPHGMVPKPAFCSIPHENVVFAVFFAWWVAGAVRKPANSLDFCNQPSENVLFAMFWLRHRGVVQPRPLLFLCQIVI